MRNIAAHFQLSTHKIRTIEHIFTAALFVSMISFYFKYLQSMTAVQFVTTLTMANVLQAAFRPSLRLVGCAAWFVL